MGVNVGGGGLLGGITSPLSHCPIQKPIFVKVLISAHNSAVVVFPPSFFCFFVFRGNSGTMGQKAKKPLNSAASSCPNKPKKVGQWRLKLGQWDNCRSNSVPLFQAVPFIFHSVPVLGQPFGTGRLPYATRSFPSQHPCAASRHQGSKP